MKTGTHNALHDIAAEYDKARQKFRGFASAHEGWAVIREELDELWDEVRKVQPSTHDFTEARKEAVQIGAMALAFILEVCDVPAPPLAPRVSGGPFCQHIGVFQGHECDQCGVTVK